MRARMTLLLLLLLELQSALTLATSGYECSGPAPVHVVLGSQHTTIELESPSYPEFPNATKCEWRVTAVNGARVRVTVLESEPAPTCLSSSVLSLSDESLPSSLTSSLRFPGVEHRCHAGTTLPSSDRSLTAEGALTITATAGLRHRLKLEATPPLECPEVEPKDLCPKGPCCDGEKDCVCQFQLGTDPVWLQPGRSGLCTVELVAAPGSQVSVNFVSMRLPEAATGCEAWVALEEQGGHPASLIGSGDRKFCGLTVPNYPGPSVLTSASSSLTLRYNLPASSADLTFMAIATAVNPLCSPTSFMHRYGASTCEASCGEERLEPGVQPPEPCDPAPRQALALTLLDEDTGAPVVGAEVNITSAASSFSHRTDSSGSIEYSAAGATNLTIKVTANGYMTSQRSLLLHCISVDCLDCSQEETVLVRPLPFVEPVEPGEFNGTCPNAVTIDLNVVGADRMPVPGVAINLSFVNNGSKAVVVEEGTVTDGTGHFTWTVDMEGNYQVNLEKEGWIKQELAVGIQNCTSENITAILEKEEQCNATLNLHVWDPEDNYVPFAKVSIVRTGTPESSQELSRALESLDLTTDAMGQLVVQMEPGEFQIEVSAPGFYPQVININLDCPKTPLVSENTTTVPPVVVILDPTPTPEPTPTPGPGSTPKPLEATCFGPDDPPILLELSAVDLLTEAAVPGAKGNITIEVEGKNLSWSGDLGTTWSFTLTRDGVYAVSVAAAGYLPDQGSITVACDPDNCSACTPSLTLELEQEGCEGGRTLSVAVWDSVTNVPVPGAKVTVTLAVGDLSVPVSPHMVCGEQGLECGPAGTQEDACLARSCCWNPLVTTESPPVTTERPPVAMRIATTTQDTAPSTTASPAENPTTSSKEPTTQSPKLTTQSPKPTTQSPKPTTQSPKPTGQTNKPSATTTTFMPTTSKTVSTATTTATPTGQCLQKVQSDLTTSAAGLVVVPLPGRGEYTVVVERPGFLPVQQTLSVSSCDPPTLEITLAQPSVCQPKGLNLTVIVLDAKTGGLPLPKAAVQLTLTSSALGPCQVEVAKELTTDSNGVISTTLSTNGTYRIGASHLGYEALTIETDLATATCPGENVTVHMAKITVPEPPCKAAGLDLVVEDQLTGAPVQGALLDVSSLASTIPVVVASGVRTDSKGRAHVAVSHIGRYKVSLLHGSGYTPIAVEGTLDSCFQNATLVIQADQPRCKDTLVPVTITDNITGLAIPSARVTLLLTHSLSGSSLAQQGIVHISDSTGKVTLQPVLNGNYSVRVEAEDYLPMELPFTLHCNPSACTECRLALAAELKQEFCPDRVLTMNVKDSLTNSVVEGAVVTMTLTTHKGPMVLATLTVGSNGTVLLPITGNGHYTATITAPGYYDLASSIYVEVTPDQCSVFAPIQLIPLSTELEPGCVRMSLIWGAEPADLDLYSYRVNKEDPNDQCLTYFCEGKDPCNGTAFDIDNQDGGEAGAETITYCGVEDYSNMVWVDDRSGLGSSLMDSDARLLVTAASGETREVKLRPVENEQGARYWLAGCLTTNGTSFGFLELNQFTSEKPSREQPLHCHSRTELEATAAPTKGLVEVTVATTVGSPIAGASVRLTSGPWTHTGITNTAGLLEMLGAEPGAYSLLVELDGWIPERINFTVGSEARVAVQVTMLKSVKAGGLRVKLDWGGAEGRDLDLNLLQVANDGSQAACLTFWHNDNGCEGATLDQNVGLPSEAKSNYSMAETITIKDFGPKLNKTFMIFVDDHTTTGTDFSLVTPHLTLSDGTSTRSLQMPGMPADAEASARYWLAGCLQAENNGFHYIPVDMWSRASPRDDEKLHCHNLFMGTPLSLGPQTCPGSNLTVTIKEAGTEIVVPFATTSVTLVEGVHEQVLLEGGAPGVGGWLHVGLTGSGTYVVKVDADGYISEQREVVVDCSLPSCSSCQPSVVVQLTPSLAPHQLRLTLAGPGLLQDMDLRAELLGEVANRADTKDTHGITLTAGETTSALYAVSVVWTGTGGEPAALNSPGARIVLTDGTSTEDVLMEGHYGGERHWFAGCLMVNSASAPRLFHLHPVNTFLPGSPVSEVPNLCLDSFGLERQTESTTETHKGSWWSNLFG